MKKVILLLLSMILTLSLAGCAGAVEASELKSDKPRDTSPSVSSDELAALVEGNNAFALNLYRLLSESDGNLFYSPYSISEALAMTYGGARGETEKQMAEALQFYLSQDALHKAFNYLDIELAKRGEGAEGQDDEGFRLNIVNAIWGQRDYKFTDAYLDLLAENYGAGLRVLDFTADPEACRDIINQWVSDQTEERIKDLLPEGSIDPDTRLVLTNAIYFNASWAYQFNEDLTAEGEFTLPDGSTVKLPFMHQNESFRYGEGADYQAIELPYDGNELSMVIVLPSEGEFNSFEGQLDSAKLAAIIDGLENSQVDLSMPKFNIESEFELNKALEELGMPVAFSGNADFSGMDGTRDLFISDVVHKSFVDVDEKGTEAAAATGVIMKLTAMPVDVKEMNIDSPFIFLIRDMETNSILFLGRVMNPA
jgi:serpin B